MPTVRESFAHCRQVARTRARNFYYSFLLLPRERKEAMCAIYAFMRYADDISDQPDPPRETRVALLDRWRKAFQISLQGEYGNDPILPALHETVRKYAIPSEYFSDLIDGVRSDLSTTCYHTFDDLYRYCYRVASVVGMTTVHVFGFDSPEALRFAEKCGIAFQLTNILRDIPEDARLGRVYLPQEDLDRFGLQPEDLKKGRFGTRFRELMEFEWQRAESYYRESAPLLKMVRPDCRAALWAMISIYHRLLRRIRSENYDVFTRRPRLSATEKAWIVTRALGFRLFGGAPPFPA